jgi:hypothetical protein
MRRRIGDTRVTRECEGMRVGDGRKVVRARERRDGTALQTFEFSQANGGIEDRFARWSHSDQQTHMPPTYRPISDS